MRSLLIFLLATQPTYGQIGQIKLLDFKSSTCDEPTLSSRLKARIVKKEIKDDVLTVDIATVETCCVTFEPIVSTNEGILYLDVKETGAECECDCYYFLTYKVQGVKDKDVRIKFHNKDIELSDEKFETFPIRFKMLNGDTINFVDKYGYPTR